MKEFSYEKFMVWQKMSLINSLITSVSIGFIFSSLTKLEGTYLKGEMLSLLQIVSALVAFSSAIWSVNLRSHKNIIRLYTMYKLYISPIMEFMLLPILFLLTLNFNNILIVSLSLTLWNILSPIRRITDEKLEKYILEENDFNTLQNIWQVYGAIISIGVGLLSFSVFSYFGEAGLLINIWIFLVLKSIDLIVTIIELVLFNRTHLTQGVLDDYIMKFKNR